MGHFFAQRGAHSNGLRSNVVRTLALVMALPLAG